MFATLQSHLADYDIHAASDEAVRLAKEEPDKCVCSAEFLLMAARVCALTRQWGLAQLLAHRSWILSGQVGEASSLFAFAGSCDLVLRNPVDWERVLELLPIFGNSDNSRLKFLMQLTAYCPLPARVSEIVQHELDMIVKSNRKTDFFDEWEIHERIKKLDCQLDWVLQVDAGEIGNEARYCNHADIPNAILVHRLTGSGKSYPHVVALADEIWVGDEITLNYGASYWKSCDPGSDPLMFDLEISQPFTDCIYFDGVLEDFSCSKMPGGFLILPNHQGQTNSDISVKQVPRSHPAFPGFGVYANKKFCKNETICIYAGIVDMSPFSGRHASKYTVDISSGNAVGPFGFTMDPKTLNILPRQKFMPFITDFPDISLPVKTNILEDLEEINEIGPAVTQTIARVLLKPEYRSTILEKLRQIPIPFRNASKRDLQEWTRLVRKLFEDILTKPPMNEPKVGKELIFLMSPSV